MRYAILIRKFHLFKYRMISEDEEWLRTMDLRVIRITHILDDAIDAIHEYVEDTIKHVKTTYKVKVNNHIYNMKGIGEFIGTDSSVYVGNISYFHKCEIRIDFYIQCLDEITMV